MVAGVLTRHGQLAWSTAFAAEQLASVRAAADADAAAWALEGSTGAGVRSRSSTAVWTPTTRRVGGIAGAVAFEPVTPSPRASVSSAGPHEDLVGHGTACAGIIRSLAPDAEIYSVRVLGTNLEGRGSLLRAGIAWAVEHGMAVANLSLSGT